MRILFWGVISIMVLGCGASLSNRDKAYGEPPAPPSSMKAGNADYDNYAYPPESASAVMEESYSYNDYSAKKMPEADSRSGNTGGAGQGVDSVYPTVSDSVESSASVSTAPLTNEVKVEHADPMVIYTGYLQLRVRRIIEAQDQITAFVNKRGGYIEALTGSVVIVRIPGKKFEEAMKELSALGDLLDKWVQAEDVTEQFTDLRARLDVALQARERLTLLLKKTPNTTERLRILNEIKRLSELIDTIDASLAAIKNLTDFFTITIELVPVLEVDNIDRGLSPFPWVRGLKPHLQTIDSSRKDKKSFLIKLPKGFVLFDKEDAFKAQSADTSIIRASVVENEPSGNNEFWSNAIDFEMASRQENLVDKGKQGSFVYRLYENRDINPRFYLIAVHTSDLKIYVVEAFFPNVDSKNLHYPSIIEMLKSVEVI